MEDQIPKKNKTSSNKVKFIPATQIALLSLLSEEPAHAWLLKKKIDERGYEEWVDMKRSTIYKSLGILEREKYILGEKTENDTYKSILLLKSGYKKYLSR
ncbi:MAG: hypothetical protein ACFFDC_11800 [Promethearchaeota archaeon]